MNKTLKSILSLVLCVCFVLALSACGKQNNDTTANNTDTNVSNNNVTDDNTDDSADITPEESTTGDSNILFFRLQALIRYRRFLNQRWCAFSLWQSYREAESFPLQEGTVLEQE